MNNDYSRKLDAELDYIIVDAGDALHIAEQNGDQACISKYADQVNDACTERYRRELRRLTPVGRKASKNLCTNVDYHHI
jgi:hypothetical protein